MNTTKRLHSESLEQIGPYTGDVKSLTEARKDIFNLAKQVINQCKAIFIYARVGRLVLVSLEEYNKLITMARKAMHYRSLVAELEETIDLLRDEKTMSALKQSLEEGPDSENLIPTKEVREKKK